MSQVVEELVAKPFALVRSGDETGYVEQFNGHTTLSVHAGAVVGLAPFANAIARAGTVYLEVADRSLGVDGGETEVAEGIAVSATSFESACGWVQRRRQWWYERCEAKRKRGDLFQV